jgi:hypothetical protein
VEFHEYVSDLLHIELQHMAEYELQLRVRVRALLVQQELLSLVASPPDHVS